MPPGVDEAVHGHLVQPIWLLEVFIYLSVDPVDGPAGFQPNDEAGQGLLVFRRQVRSDDTTAQHGLGELRARSIRMSLGYADLTKICALVCTHLANHLALQTSVEDAHLRLSHAPRKVPPDPQVVRIQRVIRRVRLERHLPHRVGYGEGVAWVTVSVDQSRRLGGRQVAEVVGDCGADGIDWR